MIRKKTRFRFIIIVLFCLSIAAGLALYAMQDNIAFFYSPMQIKEFQQKKPKLVKVGRIFRLGGLVEKGSVKKYKDKVLVSFIVTDGVEELKVQYSGILPDLFREGQGVVAKGSLNDKNIFIATEVLAKHDENYRPPELSKALEKAAKVKAKRQGKIQGKNKKVISK